MNRPDFRSIAELIGILAVVASLIFVGIQLRLDQEIAASQGYMDAAAAANDLAALITENQDVWIDGLDGEELAASDQVRFDTVIYAVIQRKAAIWQRRLRLDAGDPESWVSSFAYELYIYPGLRASFERLGASRSLEDSATGLGASTSGFGFQVTQILAELDSSMPEKPAELSYNLR